MDRRVTWQEGGATDMSTEIWWGNMMGRGNLAGHGGERKVLLKCISNK